MSHENYEYYIFRLGQNQQTGQNLFPDFGDETDQYRFLHETSHAYQDYLMNKESNGEKDKWYDKVINREINSIFGILFEYCYKKRREQNSGLSTWGNVPDYNNVSEPSQSAVRAIEDANELITMYLWNPKYLDIFLDYVSCNIDGFNEENIRNDGLSKITQQERSRLKQLIQEYIKEMKQNINPQ